MAEDKVEFEFGGKDSGLGKILKDLTAEVRALRRDVQDMGEAFVDAGRAQTNFAKGTKNVQKESKDSVKSVNNLKSAVAQTGKEFQKSISKLSLKEVRDQFTKLSSGEITSLSSKLREVGTSLSEFLGGGGQVADPQQLQLIRYSQALEEVANTARSAEGPIKSLRDRLSGADVGGVKPYANELIAFDKLQTEAEASLGEVDFLNKKLEQIGPAAQEGNQQAIAEVIELSAKLKEATLNTVRLESQLEETGRRAGRAFASQNTSLEGLGFRQIKLNDIFPSSEQQKVAQLQQKIDNAVRQSVEEGAVKRSLNYFLAQDRQLKSVDRNVVQLTSHLPRLRYALYDVANTATIFGTALVGAVAGVVKVAADFERSFADVIRTTQDGTDETRAKVNELRTDLINLSKDLPVSFSDLAEIATLAGQLNVAVDVVDDFTKAVAQFSATTDVTTDAAATAFGRLDQLVDGVNGQFEKLGSSILKVGVNAVATESDIIAISTQIASVANVAGFSAAELIGFSSALASVGTRPELARGTFTRLFTEIQQAVAVGGEQLEDFARIAGQSQEEFIAAWGAGSGTEQVVAILEGLNAAGTGADGALRQLGITSVRDVPTLLKLAQGVEQVKEQITLAKIGFDEGTELQEQYSIITSTLSERLAVLKNNFTAVAAALGSISGPVSIVVEGFSLLLSTLETILKNPVGQFIAGISAVMLTAIGVSSLLVAAMARLGGSFAGAGTALTELLGTIGLVKVSVDQIRGATQSKIIVDAKEDALEKQNLVTKRKRVIALARSQAAMRKTVVSSTAFNLSLQTQKLRLQTAGASLAAYSARVKLAGLRFVEAARYTKAFGFAVKGLKSAFGVGALLAVSAAIEAIVSKMNEASNATQDLEERFENWGSILEAVKQDSKDFANATADNIGEFTVIGEVAGEAGEQISEYSRALAATNGEEEALADLLDNSSDAFERQAIAIGKNTRALLAQNLAKELAAAAEQDNPFVFAFNLATEGLRGDFSGLTAEGSTTLNERGFQESIGALISTFGTDLSLALQQSGFSYAQWSNAILSGNRELADSFAERLSPAAKKLADELEAEDAKKYADEIATLRTIAYSGTDALLNFASSNDAVINAVTQAKIEIEAMGGIYSEAEEELRDFQEALSGVVDAAYAQVNAERAMSESIRRLGGVFQEEGSQVAATSQEMQTAIRDVINAADSEEDAVAGLSGFYSAIVDGGYASADQLEILQGVIISTYRTAAAAQIQTLQDMKNALDITKALANADGSDKSKFRLAAENDAETQRLNAQIAALKNSMESIDSIADVTGDASEAAALLARGYEDAADSASGAADAAEDVEEATEKAVRTLLDYGSDLENVFSRAFDLRFADMQGIDDIADAWEDFSEQVESAKVSLEELAATQQDLAADRAIKEYFLSVAEAYDDQLRAAKLRAEIAELDREQADAAKELADAQEGAAGANDLTGQSAGARQNRQALLGLVRDYQDYITVLAESGASQDELREATQDARAEFIQQATALGFAEQDVLMYADAFDDVRTAIDRVPRDVTVDFNADPALQALNELNAKLDSSISKAKELNSVSGAGPAVDYGKQARAAAIGKEIDQKTARLYAPGTSLGSAVGLSNQINALQKKLASGHYASGGFTGRGGKMDPAGIVHRGEYVVPKQYVNQSTGMPDPNFLAQLQSGMRGYANGGFVGGGMGDGTMMVELSPYDRKLLQDAGNVQLRVNGRILAETTNTSNFNEARRGSN